MNSMRRIVAIGSTLILTSRLSHVFILNISCATRGGEAMTGASMIASRQDYYSPKMIPKAVKPIRIALYSHDTMGLGHTRRNLLIAQSFAKANTPVSVLMIGGVNEATHFAKPSYVDYLTLPSLHKNGNGNYSARSLELSLEEISELRSTVIWKALKSFKRMYSLLTTCRVVPITNSSSRSKNFVNAVIPELF
jgi:hypothetical protein